MILPATLFLAWINMSCIIMHVSLLPNQAHLYRPYYPPVRSTDAPTSHRGTRVGRGVAEYDAVRSGHTFFKRLYVVSHQCLSGVVATVARHPILRGP